MNSFFDRSRRVLLPLLLACAVLFAGGCATLSDHSEELPPLLAQDELLRPYQKAASIEVHRERYGSPEDLVPADYDWAYQAPREEAAKIGADAVILPEVTVEQQIYLLFPVSRVKAKGVAIKFK